MLNGLDLFSGIGGLSIALSEWVRPIAYCEIDPYCQAVLLSRMAESVLPNAPIWDDIRTLTRERLPYQFPIDIICAGFPCQDISVAGLGKGLEGERSGLVFEVFRLAKEIKPSFIFLENVRGITFRGGLQVVKELADLGYDCRWCVMSAASVGALHRRERWFLLAHAMQSGERRDVRAPHEDERKDGKKDLLKSELSCADVADTESERLQEKRQPIGSPQRHTMSCFGGEYASIHDWQEAVSSVCRVTDGVSYRLDRIRALGNSVVSRQAKEAFKILMGLK